MANTRKPFLILLLQTKVASETHKLINPAAVECPTGLPK